MNVNRTILISLCLALVGVGFILYVSETAAPRALSGAPDAQVDDYVEVMGVVSRLYTVRGNVFFVVSGAQDVSVPLFYGMASAMEHVPSAGDIVKVRGTLSCVDVAYLRQYWPLYELQISAPEDVEVLGRASLEDIERTSPSLSLAAAGCCVEVYGTVREIGKDGILIGESTIPLKEYVRVGDQVRARVLVTEEEHCLSLIILDSSVEAACAVPLSTVFREGEAYRVSGTVASVRPYYGGILLRVEDESGVCTVYSRGGIRPFWGDEVDARGVYRTYYGAPVLFVGQQHDLSLIPRCATGGESPLAIGLITALPSHITRVTYTGNHPVCTVETPYGTVTAHIYAEDRDRMERLGAPAARLVEGAHLRILFELVSLEGDITAKIIDYADLCEIHK